jgi:multidrug transporter EmrE-like cation transporter
MARNPVTMGAMLQSAIVRYVAIILGTVLWDVGAIMQKKAVSGFSPNPSGKLPVTALLGSGGWMLGLLFTTLGWGMFVFGLAQVPISAARTITGGSYVVLALFSIIFLRTSLSPAEWAALACVTVGIVFLGLQESVGPAPGAPSAEKVLLGVACVTVVSVLVFLAPRWFRRSSRSAMIALFAFAALSGLLGSVGDLLTKVFIALFQAGRPLPVAILVVTAVGFVTFYLAGFYMLSRAYQVGTVVGGVVISDFFSRVGVLFLGALSLSEPIGGPGAGGLLRVAGFVLVLGGSLLLGRFSSVSRPSASPQ